MIARRFPPTIRQLLSHKHPISSTEIEVNGWVKSVRRQKNVSFAIINDGSSTHGLQAVFRDGQLATRLTNGTSVRLFGELAVSLGPGQHHELQVNAVQILGECNPETYPIQKQAHTVEYLRDQCHLRARVDRMGAMLRIRDKITRTMHTHFEDQAFKYVHTPILTSSDCEGAGEVFGVYPSPTAHSPSTDTGTNGSTNKPSHFFGHPTFLTVSSQLHLEALATSLSRVYTMSPCFRAERSQTNRHLAEFWMLEAEWAFTKCIEDVTTVVEDVSRAVISSAEAESDDMDMLWKNNDMDRWQMLKRTASSQQSWTRMTYTDAVHQLETHHSATKEFQFSPHWGNALQSEHEKWIAEKLVAGPVFITDYPASLKPFYMRQNNDGRTVACFDLLVPGVGELVGGSLREERLTLLDAALERDGLDKQEYGWYRDIRRFGGAPHGGFGLGLERMVSWVTGIENVRECIPMPRWAGRILL